MAEYIKKEPFLDKLLYMGYFDDNNEIEEVADNFTTENVIERSKIDKAIEDIERSNCFYYGSEIGKGIEIALEILRRNIGE